MIEKQKIIPSISNMKAFELFIESDYQYCFVMDFHISLLKYIIDQLHLKDKKVIVHIDLIHGLSSDEFGCEYLCQVLKADGVISTKSKILEVAKKNKKISILRLFLIDSMSLNKGLLLAQRVQPDYLEVLPALALEIIPHIIEKCSISLIGGGLLSNLQQVEKCLDSGVKAVSVSKLDVWKK